MSRSDAVNATEQRVREIAYNIEMHYRRNFRGTGFKGQLATASKELGLKYTEYLNDLGVKAALAISPPDMREGGDEVNSLEKPKIQAFWKKMMDRHGSEDDYNRELLSSFKKPDGIEILVVVDKLLTGFDEPMNTVLYIDKPLKEHTLLQAIARVNRLNPGKEYGYIVDYRGVLGQLNEAMDMYDALAEFDNEDIDGAFTDVQEEIDNLPQRHSDLWAIFAPVANKKDIEAMTQHLEPEDIRQQFYEALSAYASCLRVALASVPFYQQFSEAQINTYKNDLTYLTRLRQAAKQRYAEAIDYRDYEEKVRKLMDEHVKATDMEQITELVNIFDVEAFDAEVARLHSPKAKADTILHRMKRTITMHMDEDPAFYRKFADMVEETILAYRQGRIDEAELFRRAKEGMDAMRAGQDGEDVPEKLFIYPKAKAYYGVLREPLVSYGVTIERIADLAIHQDALIEKEKVIDWMQNRNVIKRMKGQLNHNFYLLEDELGIRIPADAMDHMIEQVIDITIAQERNA